MSAMETSSNKRKLNRKVRYALIALDFISLIYVLNTVPVFVILNGDKKMDVEIHSVFEDPGAVSSFSGAKISAKGNVDTEKLGTYTLSYSSGLQTLRRKVTVVDSTAPVISIEGRDLFIPLHEDYELPSAIADDNCDGDLSESLNVISYIDKDTAGVYDVVYSVSDLSGNEAEKILKAYVYEDDYQYCDLISNADSLDPEISSLIKGFNDAFYRSLKYLENEDLSSYFAEGKGEVFKTALSALIEYRKEAYNDLRMDDVSYSLQVEDVRRTRSGYRVTVLEDASMYFHFLDGVQSKTNDIVLTFEIVKQDSVWKIADVSREEGVFLYFEDAYAEGTDLSKIKEGYLDLMLSANERYETQRKLVNEGSIADAMADYEGDYDRQKATDYARTYALSRNDAYDSFSSNCVNFVSQCLVAGGIKMDYEGAQQWKYYNFSENNADGQYGYTYSFTYIPAFIDYLKNGSILCEVNSSLYLAKPGDVIAIDYEDTDMSDSPHVILVSEVIEDEEGIKDLLICGSTNDQLDYPLSALSYPYKKLIRIFANKE